MSETQPEHLKSLPTGWCWASIGQCSELVQYGSSAKATDDARGVPVLRMGNIRNDGRLDIDRLKYLPAGHNEFPELLLRSGDLLFNRTNSAELVGKTAVYRGVPSPCSFASYLIRVRLHLCVLPTLVSESLNSADGRRWIGSVLNQTVGQANVNGTKLAAFQFALPPLQEQGRLVDSLDELFSDLDAGVEALERVRQKLKLYRGSVLKAAVEGALTSEWRGRHPKAEPASDLLGRILAERRRRWEEEQLARFKTKSQQPPKNWKAKYKEPIAPDAKAVPLTEGWSWAVVGQLLTGIEAGKSFTCEPRRAALAEWGVIKVSAMSWGRFDENENKAVPFGKECDPDFEIRAGDLLLSRSNTVELVGATVLVEQCRRQLLLSDKSMRLLYNSGICARWLRFAMASGFAREQMSKMATGTSDSMRNISQENVARVVLAVPSLAEQEAIVEAVEDQLSVVDHLEADIDAKLRRAQSLRQAILRHAFSGKLVPQDPNDEPASELLKRIAAEREAHAREAVAAKRASKPAGTRRRVSRRPG